MKKKTKKILIFVPTAAFVILTTFFIIDRFFWQYFDYYFCAAPQEICYHVKKADDYSAVIWLYQQSSAAIDRFGGYDYYVKDHVVYLGVNIIYYFGDYIQMPTIINIKSKEKIQKIVLKGNGKEKVIYPNSTN